MFGVLTSFYLVSGSSRYRGTLYSRPVKEPMVGDARAVTSPHGNSEHIAT